MKISDKISVVIPTYNGSRFIRETIESIHSQTVLPREIIVVDDVSTDNTQDIVKKLQDISPVPLHFIQLDKNSGGPAKPINTGIKKAKGEYIAICEQDDLMLPNKIEMLSKFIQLEPGVQFIISRYNVLISNELKQQINIINENFSDFESIKKTYLINKFYYFDKEQAYFHVARRNFAISLSNMCFSKRLWKTLNGLNEDIRAAVDWDLLFKVAYNYKIGWIDCPLWIFRRHVSSLSQKTDTINRITEGITIWKKEIEKTDISKRAKSELYYNLFSNYKKLDKKLTAKYYFFKALLYNPKDSFARYHLVLYTESNYPKLYKILKWLLAI